MNERSYRNLRNLTENASLSDEEFWMKYKDHQDFIYHESSSIKNFGKFKEQLSQIKNTKEKKAVRW